MTDSLRRQSAPLSDQYHRAHKQATLWGALLLTWELVGIDLEKMSSSGGNIGPIISAIKSPQSVPWVLGVVLGYFLFKLTIEWHQCSKNRRALLASKIDFLSSWFIAVCAYTLYLWQVANNVQFADRYRAAGYIATVVLLSAALAMLIANLIYRKRKVAYKPLIAHLMIVALSAVIVIKSLSYPLSWFSGLFAILGLTVALRAGINLSILFARWLKFLFHAVKGLLVRVKHTRTSP